jgi:hypothetical protein
MLASSSVLRHSHVATRDAGREKIMCNAKARRFQHKLMSGPQCHGQTLDYWTSSVILIRARPLQPINEKYGSHPFLNTLAESYDGDKV